MSTFENFHYAISLAQQMYNIEGDTEDLEEIGLVAYHMIGNKRTRLYRAQLQIGEDGRALLPCNCDRIEAVTYCGSEDWAYTSNIHHHGDPQSRITEDYIEGQFADGWGEGFEQQDFKTNSTVEFNFNFTLPDGSYESVYEDIDVEYFNIHFWKSDFQFNIIEQ